MIKTQRKKLVVAAMLLVITLSVIVLSLRKTSKVPDQPKPTRILTWWGYLDSRKRNKEIERFCNTKLHIIHYLNTDELESYAAADPYDLYIYPWSYHQNINQHFNQKGPSINLVVQGYHSSIKEKYHRFNIPPDTVFFQHAVAMFVYDKSHITDLNSLNAQMVLNYANVGKVYLMDSLHQMDWLIKKLEINTPDENWVAVYQQVKAHQALRANSTRHNKQPLGLHFSNYVTDYLDKDLVLGFLNSSELMNPNIKWPANANPEQPKLGFGVHSSLSYVSADVLALKSHNSKDQCVANFMSSRHFLRWISETAFDYSPFEERIDSLPDPLPQLSQAFYNQADKMPWLGQMAMDNPPNKDAKTLWKLMTFPEKRQQEDQDVIIRWDPELGVQISRYPAWLIQLFPFLK